MRAGLVFYNWVGFRKREGKVMGFELMRSKSLQSEQFISHPQNQITVFYMAWSPGYE